jgi:two-component system phosphate regulon response regulator PhoB
MAAQDLVRSCLEAAGHRSRFASSGEEALKLARDEAPAFVVTELSLPDLSGLGLCRALREDPALARIPLLMLTASGAEMDRVVAFEVGVDDFVAKPFHPRELALRVSAILRRARKQNVPASGESLRFQRLFLDLGQHQVRVDEQPVDLTAREFDVLAAMMQSAGRVLSRRQILQDVWGTRSGKTQRVVDTHVKWIRRKLGPAGNYIETLRGVGYRFSDRAAGTLAAND